MGFKDADWAYTVEGLTAPQKAVLVAIAHATDDKTHVTLLGQQALAARTALAVETVRRAVGVLDQLGVIQRRERHGQNGYRTSDETTVNTAYQAESLPGSEPAGQTARRADSGRLPVSQSAPTGHGEGAEEITQIDQPEDQPDLRALDLPDGAQTVFDAFWTAWPRKVAKKAAKNAWMKAIRTADREQIYAAALAYANHPHRPAIQYVPHAATWLNGERWNDPLPEPPEADTRGRPTPTDRARAVLALVPPVKEIYP